MLEVVRSSVPDDLLLLLDFVHLLALIIAFVVVLMLGRWSITLHLVTHDSLILGQLRRF